MKKTVIIGGIIIIILFIAYVAAGPKGGSGSSSSDVLAKQATILRYQIGLPAATGTAQAGSSTTATDYGFLSYNFNTNDDGQWYAQGFVDANGDGTFSNDEWVVKNEPAHVSKNFPNRFSITLPDSLKATDAPKTVPVMIALTKARVGSADVVSSSNTNKYTLDATVETVPITDEFGLNVPGASEDLKRGVGLVHYAYAQGTQGAQAAASAGVNGANLPDLGGGPMDCFAIATANNLINMAIEHGRRDDLPDPQELLRELKDAMQWNNGITSKNFLAGKKQFLIDVGFPVTTEVIKRPSIDELKHALATGDGVEISTAMIRSASGHANTGHVLTGVSATSNGSSITVHDPATPKGNDSLSTSMTGGATPYILIKYPMWDGVMVVDAIYVQHWKEPAATSTERSSTTVGEQKKTENTVGAGGAASSSPQMVEVIKYGDKYLPIDQLIIENETGCGANHWHAAQGMVIATDGTPVPDPGPQCGYCKVADCPVIKVPEK